MRKTAGIHCVSSDKKLLNSYKKMDLNSSLIQWIR